MAFDGRFENSSAAPKTQEAGAGSKTLRQHLEGEGSGDDLIKKIEQFESDAKERKLRISQILGMDPPGSGYSIEELEARADENPQFFENVSDEDAIWLRKEAKRGREELAARQREQKELEAKKVEYEAAKERLMNVVKKRIAEGLGLSSKEKYSWQELHAEYLRKLEFGEGLEDDDVALMNREAAREEKEGGRLH